MSKPYIYIYGKMTKKKKFDLFFFWKNTPNFLEDKINFQI